MAAVLVPSSYIVHEVLHQDNYELWSRRIKSYLVARDLWGIVKPTREPPKQEENEVEYQVWSKRNSEALHAIHICCGDDMFPLVSDLDTAKAAWDSLEQKFMQSAHIPFPDDGTISSSVVAGDAPGSVETPIPLMYTVQDFRREFNSDSGDDAEIERCLRLMQHFIPEYGFRNALFILCAKTGSLDGIENILTQYPDVIKARSLSTGMTALHSAVYGGHTPVVKKLVECMSAEDLELLGNGQTALVLVAQMGSIEMAEWMVEKNERLPTIRCFTLPIQYAIYNEKWDMVRYLYRVTPIEVLKQEHNGRCGAQIISSCLYSHELDIALDLIRQCPNLALVENYNGESNLYILTSMRSLFLTGTRMKPLQKLIYKSIQIQPSTSDERSSISATVVNIEDGSSTKKNIVIHSVKDFFQRLMTSFLDILGVNHIRQKKRFHIRTLEILKFMSQALKGLTSEKLQGGVVEKSILQAIERGNVEFVRAMSDVNHMIYMLSDGKGKNLLHYSIECRQEEIYCLLFRSIPRNIRERHIVNGGDKFGNTILHSAASLSPVAIAHLNQIQGAALQLQRELQWFQEVESIVPSKVHEMVNYDRMTARELFTKNHKKMLDDGERQMKEIATSSTVVGALIVTMMFAAAFTVPGGTNGETGMPVFKTRKMFTVFVVSNSVSLFASTTSIVIFLGILTSRYAEDDFLKSLPTKLVMALFTLFFSIATMMIAFVSAIVIMFEGTRWIIILVVMLAAVPISSFAWMQFPLLVEIVISTFGRGVFHNKMELR